MDFLTSQVLAVEPFYFLTHSRKYALLSDDALLSIYYQQQDVNALGMLLQRHTTMLLGVAYKYLKEENGAADAVQHILLQALTHFPNEPVQNLKGWLYVLLRNHCLSLLRNTKHTQSTDNTSVAADSQEVNDRLLWENELKIDTLMRLLAQLPEAQQQCLHAFYMKGKSYEQIMDDTGFTFMQVKSHIQNGKRKLRILMLREGHSS